MSPNEMTPEERQSRGTYLPKDEAGPGYPPDRTALLVIDPVNDFLSEGGAAWELTKGTVEHNDVVRCCQSNANSSPRDVDRSLMLTA
jgi:hypothetical protein